jgi:hypothetical protein
MTASRIVFSVAQGTIEMVFAVPGGTAGAAAICRER